MVWSLLRHLVKIRTTLSKDDVDKSRNGPKKAICMMRDKQFIQFKFGAVI